MSQTVWFFAKPTIMWCEKHESTEFVHKSHGMECVHKDCQKEYWVEFTCEAADYHDANEFEPHAECEECEGSGILVGGIVDAAMLIPEGWDLAQKCDQCNQYDNDLEAADDHYARTHEQMDSHGRLHIIVCNATFKGVDVPE